MIAFLLPLLTFGKSAFSAVAGWLSRRSLKDLCLIGCVCVCIVLYWRADHWKAIATTRQAELVKCGKDKADLKAQLDSISSKRNEQKVITRDRIVTVVKLEKVADQRAKQIESAPLPPENRPEACHTPDAVVKEPGL